jgi:hypothetical protein
MRTPAGSVRRLQRKKLPRAPKEKPQTARTEA